METSNKRIDVKAPTQRIEDFVTYDSKTGAVKSNPMFHVKNLYKNVGASVVACILDDIDNVRRTYDTYMKAYQTEQTKQIETADTASDVVSNPIVKSPKLSSTLVTLQSYLMSTYKLSKEHADYLAEHDEDAKKEYQEYLAASQFASFTDIKKAKKESTPLSLKDVKKETAKNTPAPAPAIKKATSTGKDIAFTVQIGKQVHPMLLNKSQAMDTLVGKELVRVTTVNGKQVSETKLVTPVPPGSSKGHYFDSYVQQGYIKL